MTKIAFRGHKTRIDPIDEIIAEAVNGRPFILVDDEDRENEGDIVIPAEFATPEAVAFMACHGRGLICVALTRERAEKIGLQPVAREQRGFATAFTQSIEARTGITTGISAADRARTIEVATDPQYGPEAISSPGHVFPLIARRGGTLIRPGHTEAAVDVSRLAGLNPAGVICEIMKDDGTMARLPDVLEFAARHGLKVGTIADLIEYRLVHDKLIQKAGVEELVCPRTGHWHRHVYQDTLTGAFHYAMTQGVMPGRAGALPLYVSRRTASDSAFSPRNMSCFAAAEKISEHGAGLVLEIGLQVPSEPFGEMPVPYSEDVGSAIAAQIVEDLQVGKVAPIFRNDATINWMAERAGKIQVSADYRV